MTLDEYKSLQVGDIIKFTSESGIILIMVRGISQSMIIARKLFVSNDVYPVVHINFSDIESRSSLYAPDKLLIKTK